MPVGSEGTVSRVLPQANPDSPSVPVVPRLGKYRENYALDLVPNFGVLADEGTYYVTTTATPGTAVNYVVNAAFSDTVAMFTLRNADAIGGKRVVPDFIRILQGATVPATATAAQYAIKLDSGTARDSAGTALTPTNPNSDSPVVSVAKANFTPTVAAATANARLVDRGVMRSVIPVANDEWLFVFGSVEKAGSISLGGAVAQRMVVPVPAIVLGPGTNQTMLLHVWFPGNAVTAGNYEVSAGWYER